MDKIEQLKELIDMLGDSATTDNKTSAYVIGTNYQLRTVTHIITGKLEAIYHDGLVLTDAAWIADTGRYADAVATADYAEVEPYPPGAKVIVNWQSMIDAVEIPNLPRDQK